jgi:ATP-dependent HslUV protease subunit HslV
MHEYTEAYLYYSAYVEETDKNIKNIWAHFYEMECAHLKIACRLFEKFENHLESTHGNLTRAAVQMAKEWRGDAMMRNLEAMLIVANKDELLVLSGNGEVITPDFDTVAIGSGGSYAYAASLALLQNTDLSAAEIARKSLEIASEICVYTNSHITVCEVKEEA